MRVVVTGIAGFAGSHLADHLVANGDEVIGLVRQGGSSPPNLRNCVHQLAILPTELLDAEMTVAVLADTAPDVIYHLAASASPRESFNDPLETLQNNILGTAAVLQGALACNPRPRVLLVTSSEIYGAPQTDEPLTEDQPPAPLSPYGVSKLTVHELALQYGRAHGLEVIEARPFNHIGPRQGLGYVVPDFASQLAGVAHRKREPVMTVGDLSAERDFTDVRDVVRGYQLAALNGQPGRVYHFCSGQPTGIDRILADLVRMFDVEVRVERDPEFSNSAGGSVLYGSAERANRELGWEPRIPLATSLKDVCKEWYVRVGREK